MGIFDKINQTLKNASKSVEEISKNTKATYKKDGWHGVLDLADQGIDKIEDVASEISRKSSKYVKSINKSNKVVVESSKQDATDEFDSMVKSAKAATLNTIKIISKDIKKQTSKLFDDSENKSLDVTVEHLLMFIGAKAGKEKNQFTVSNLTFNVAKESWWNVESANGGNGALELMKFLIKQNQPELNKSKIDVQANDMINSIASVPSSSKNEKLSEFLNIARKSWDTVKEKSSPIIENITQSLKNVKEEVANEIKENLPEQNLSINKYSQLFSENWSKTATSRKKVLTVLQKDMTASQASQLIREHNDITLTQAKQWVKDSQLWSKVQSNKNTRKKHL